MFLFNNSVWVSKNQEFHFTLILNPLKKFCKNAHKKSYQQKRDGNMYFFLYYSCSSNLLAYNIFVAFFNNFFNGFGISVKFLISFLIKNFFVILALFKKL
jgi:hypothetical protein